jgi:hypothetical protein
MVYLTAFRDEYCVFKRKLYGIDARLNRDYYFTLNGTRYNQYYMQFTSLYNNMNTAS